MHNLLFIDGSSTRNTWRKGQTSMPYVLLLASPSSSARLHSPYVMPYFPPVWEGSCVITDFLQLHFAHQVSLSLHDLPPFGIPLPNLLAPVKQLLVIGVQLLGGQFSSCQHQWVQKLLLFPCRGTISRSVAAFGVNGGCQICHSRPLPVLLHIQGLQQRFSVHLGWGPQ